MIVQNYTEKGRQDGKTLVIASMLSKGVPADTSTLPLDGRDVKGLGFNHVFYPGSTIFDTENVELWMLQEDYSWTKL